MVDYLLLALAIVLMIIGIIGCLVPVLPGPPLSFIGLLILHFTEFAEFRINLLIILGVIAVVVAIFDYVVPIWGTKKFGGTKYGIRGATVGLLIGLFFGPPGIIIGPFIGAVVGELIYKDDFRYAMRFRQPHWFYGRHRPETGNLPHYYFLLYQRILLKSMSYE